MKWLTIITVLLIGSLAAARETAKEPQRPQAKTPQMMIPSKGVSLVDRPPMSTRNSHYVTSREPLLAAPFAKLPIGAIKPGGWLRKQLENQASGFCGHLTEISRFCKKEGNAWLDRDADATGEAHGFWEEVPYWLKGFGDLGYVLDDARIETEAQEWIEAVIASRQPDGWFGPLINKTSPRNKSSLEGVKPRGMPDLWPNALMMSILRSNYEHTGDKRVIETLLAFCDWMADEPDETFLVHWVGRRRGVELLKNILWLYNVTGEKRLLHVARKVHRKTNDWKTSVSRFHNVDFSECFYEPGLYYTLSNDRSDYAAVERNRDEVYEPYGQVPGGMFGGDEKMRPGYGGPRQAVETCGMVEMMRSCEVMVTDVDGDIKWADRCEDVAFNSYPAALTAEMDALRYLTAPNQPVSDRLPKHPDIGNGGAMYIMSPHAHRCCQHNHAHGWPYYAEHLWLASADDGICAMFYCESSVTATVGDGIQVSVKQTTRYPFSDRIRFELSMEQPCEFPFYLRVPGWCREPSVAVNGETLSVAAQGGKYMRIGREWKDGDIVELTLPMKTAVRTWDANKDCVSVDRGPLTYSLKIGERVVESHGRQTIRQSAFITEDADFKSWPAYELFPTTDWNYGLLPEEGYEFSEKIWPDNDMPWTLEGAPVMLTAKAKRIPAWKLQPNNMVGAMQQSPVASAEPVETVTLLPMGACRLRISAFPTIGSGPDAHEWKEAPPVGGEPYKTKDGMQVVVSHINPRNEESPAALFDDVVPESSGDRSIPRMTFWPNKGTEESVSIEFAKERIVSGIDIYWFDDTGQGGCRVPAFARLYHFADDQWIPVLPSDEIPVARDTLNRLDIEPVSTTAIELRMTLQPNFSGGLLELRIR